MFDIQLIWYAHFPTLLQFKNEHLFLQSNAFEQRVNKQRTLQYSQLYQKHNLSISCQLLIFLPLFLIHQLIFLRLKFLVINIHEIVIALFYIKLFHHFWYMTFLLMINIIDTRSLFIFSNQVSFFDIILSVECIFVGFIRVIMLLKHMINYITIQNRFRKRSPQHFLARIKLNLLQIFILILIRLV